MWATKITQDNQENEEIMKTKFTMIVMMAVLVLQIAFAQANTTPAPAPTTEKKACACCDKDMQAKCEKECGKEMKCCTHDAAMKDDKGMKCEEGKSCCDKDCPMHAKMDKKDMKGCCGGKDGKMCKPGEHEHTGQ